jgi:hypothetical protein
MHTSRSRARIRSARLIQALRRPRAGTGFRPRSPHELWPTLPRPLVAI